MDLLSQATARPVGDFSAPNVHGPQSHSVEFYEDDAVFLDGLSEYIGSALGSGGACVVIATKAHLEALAERLQQWGIDVASTARNNRYIGLDADRTLARFMVDGWPDEQLFLGAVEPELLRASSATQRKGASVVAFGEMVARLWEQGKCEAAIRLEQIWNELVRRRSFSLRCAYPMACFSGEKQDELFRQVCAEHGAVIPAESYTSLSDHDDRSRMISSLQQKAQTLQSVVEEREREIAQRRQVEEKLRRSEEFARKILESSVDCIKVLDLEGRIEYMSPPGQRALGIMDMSSVLGRRWVEFWKEADQPQAEAALAAAQAGGLGSFSGDCPTAGGTLKSWDVRITPALGQDGGIERLIAISRDITELRGAQTAVMQAEKLAATGRLAATIAHEINNPLEAVTNLIYLAKTTPDVPEEVSQQLELADQELARVAQIAQQTLGFYRDNSTPQWTRVVGLVRDVMMIYERRTRYKRLEIEIDAHADLKLYTPGRARSSRRSRT